MGEALLGFKIADQFSAAQLGHLRGGKLKAGGFEVGVDVGGGGGFADHEDLARGCGCGQRKKR
jgi:hypothetical protein